MVKVDYLAMATEAARRLDSAEGAKLSESELASQVAGVLVNCLLSISTDVRAMRESRESTDAFNTMLTDAFSPFVPAFVAKLKRELAPVPMSSRKGRGKTSDAAGM